MTDEELKRAKTFLAAVRKALPHAHSIEKATDEYVQVEGQGYPDNPPLLRQEAGWEVDKEEFESFCTLVNFMRRSLFGVDCDGDNAVFFSIVDRTREENFLPLFRVPRIGWREGTLEERQNQIEQIESNIRSHQEKLSHLKRAFSEDLKVKLKRERLNRHAKGCEHCGGQGFVDIDRAEWEELDYGYRCSTKLVGGVYQDHTKRGPYRKFCPSCQEGQSY